MSTVVRVYLDRGILGMSKVALSRSVLRVSRVVHV